MQILETIEKQEVGLRNTNLLFTQGIIKYPFWQMTAKNRQAVYACINYGEAVCPEEIKSHSICIDGDIGDVLSELAE